MFFNGFAVCAARHESDIMARGTEPGAKIAANPTSPHHDEMHTASLMFVHKVRDRSLTPGEALSHHRDAAGRK